MPQRSLNTTLAAVDDEFRKEMARGESLRTRGLFAGDVLERAKRKLEMLMEATVIVRGTERDSKGFHCYIERPDNAIQLAAALKIVELETGKAPQAIEVMTQDQGGHAPPAPMDAVKMLTNNPALARQIIGDYIAALKQAKPTGLKVIEVDSRSSKAEK